MVSGTFGFRCPYRAPIFVEDVLAPEDAGYFHDLRTSRKLVALCELYGVRTAPHGPGDVSPIGHAANLALDIRTPSFGIQEAATLTDATREVFPGTPVPENGISRPSTASGPGVDFDESAARNHPPPEPGHHDRWALLRGVDGSAHRP